MDEETVGRLLIPAERGRNETNMAQYPWIRERRTYIEKAIPKCRVPFSYFPGSRWSESYYRNTMEAFLEIKEGNLWATPDSWGEDLGMTSITRTYSPPFLVSGQICPTNFFIPPQLRATITNATMITLTYTCNG
jgi:hypothetical protein